MVKTILIEHFRISEIEDSQFPYFQLKGSVIVILPTRGLLNLTDAQDFRVHFLFHKAKAEHPFFLRALLSHLTRRRHGVASNIQHHKASCGKARRRLVVDIQRLLAPDQWRI